MEEEEGVEDEQIEKEVEVFDEKRKRDYEYRCVFLEGDQYLGHG